MEDLSEQAIREKCPHCDTASQAFRHKLDETQYFHIVADVHPLTEGHLLIIPKQHIACIGEYSNSLFEEFQEIYQRVAKFVEKEYGSVSSFEHGKAGQTVFHSHVHLLPFHGRATDIIPEGMESVEEIAGISDLKSIYEKNGQYLFFSIGNNAWSVDASLAQPGFFRHRFARALGQSERGDWKAMHTNQKLMDTADRENERVAQEWRAITLLPKT